MNRVRTLLTAAWLASLPGAAVGCAFDGQLGDGFSTVHSASIPVALAILDGVNSGQLPRLEDVPAPLALMRANGAMRNFSAALAPSAAGHRPVALVLVEARLWGRITTTSGQTRLEAHAAGPLGGDVIVVTGEPALRALVDGRIGWDAAVATGLVVMDGPAEGREQVARLLAQAFSLSR